MCQLAADSDLDVEQALSHDMDTSDRVTLVEQVAALVHASLLDVVQQSHYIVVPH